MEQFCVPTRGWRRVRIAMGTDNPVTPHSGVLREIEVMAEAGLGAAGAFRAATLNAAMLLGLDGDRGEVSAGKRADLVVLNGAGLHRPAASSSSART